MYYLELRFNPKNYQKALLYFLEIKKHENISCCHDYYYFCCKLLVPLNREFKDILFKDDVFYFKCYYKI